jgi:hypothetical protein
MSVLPRRTGTALFSVSERWPGACARRAVSAGQGRDDSPAEGRCRLLQVLGGARHHDAAAQADKPRRIATTEAPSR